MPTPRERDDVVARARRLPEVEPHDLAPAGQLDLLDLLELLHAALHLRGLRGVGREALDEALLLGEHRLLPRVGGLALRLAQAPLALVEVVVPGPGEDLAAVDLDDPVDDAVHEVAVVARHQERAGVVVEEPLEPEDRLDVEVVRRLVHQEDVGPPEEDAGHRDAHLPAAREGADVAVDHLVGEAEPLEDLLRPRLELVAAALLVLVLDLAEALEDRLHLVGPRGVGEGVLEVHQLVVQVAEAAAPGDRLLEDRAARHLLDVLPEVADGELLRDGDVPVVGVLLAGDHPEDRRLARRRSGRRGRPSRPG